jgi:4-hydroxybenzoate polyprenyltransferase
VYSNVWVSVCAAFFTYGFSAVFPIASIPEFVFCASLFVYNAQRFYKIQYTNLVVDTPRIHWMKSHLSLVKGLIVVGLIGTVYWGIPMLFDSKYNAAIISLSAAMSILYVVRIGKYNLREIPGAKVFVITLVFFLVACLLPFGSNDELISQFDFTPSSTIVLFFVFQYLYILGMTIVFDIPDLVTDSQNLRTFPQIFGIKKTILISILFVFPLLALLVFVVPYQVIVWGFILLQLLFYAFLFKKYNKEFYISFVGEAMLLLNGLLYFLLRAI